MTQQFLLIFILIVQKIPEEKIGFPNFYKYCEKDQEHHNKSREHINLMLIVIILFVLHAIEIFMSCCFNEKSKVLRATSQVFSCCHKNSDNDDNQDVGQRSFRTFQWVYFSARLAIAAYCIYKLSFAVKNSCEPFFLFGIF